MKKRKIATILFGNYLPDDRFQRTVVVSLEKDKVKIYETTKSITKYHSENHTNHMQILSNSNLARV